VATISTIGTASRNYSTITAWITAFATGGWIGECYNDSEFLITSQLDFGGLSTSAANYVTLRAAAGQSALDNSTNPLDYDVTKGVGIRTTTGYLTMIVQNNYLTVSKLQIYSNNSSGRPFGNTAVQTLNGWTVDRCLAKTDSSDAVFVAFGASQLTNSVIILTGTRGDGCSYPYPSGANSNVIANTTIVRTSNRSAAGNAVKNDNSGNIKITNCVVFNFSAFTTTTNASGSNNATDLSSVGFGTSNQVSLTYANQFVNTVSDFRLKTGNSIGAGTGVDDTTDIPGAIDIFGTARSTGQWSIGAHQGTPGGTTYNVSISESGSAADSNSASATFRPAIAEAGTATESTSGKLTAATAITEAGSAADTAAGAMVTPGTIAESGAGATTQAGAMVTPAAIAESGTAADTPAATLTAIASIAESGGAASTQAGALAASGIIAESGTAASTEGGVLIAAVVLAESGSAGDTTSALAIFAVTNAESGSASDAYSAAGGNVFSASIAEAGTAADAYPGAMNTLAAIAESGAGASAQGGAVAYAVTIADSATAADTISAVSNFLGALVEAGLAADLPSAMALLNATVAETGSAQDAYDWASDIELPSKCLTLGGRGRVRTIAGNGRLRVLKGECCN
jgi:hypothetical protein